MSIPGNVPTFDDIRQLPAHHTMALPPEWEDRNIDVMDHASLTGLMKCTCAVLQDRLFSNTRSCMQVVRRH